VELIEAASHSLGDKSFTADGIKLLGEKTPAAPGTFSQEG